jgi:hypothetical protein
MLTGPKKEEEEEEERRRRTTSVNSPNMLTHWSL